MSLGPFGGGNKKCRSSGQAFPRGFAPSFRGFAPRFRSFVARFNALELLTAKLRRLNCGERYEDINDHRSYVHNLSRYYELTMKSVTGGNHAITCY